MFCKHDICLFYRTSALLRLFGSPAVAADVEGLALMDDAVHRRCRRHWVYEYLVPFRVRQVRRDEQAFALVALRDELEEKIGTVAALRGGPILIGG